MLLNNVHIIGSNDISSQIEITGSKISSVNTYTKYLPESMQENIFNFNDAIAFPGLINSHDHLEFNLFPKLGNRVYDDYVDWGNDIHVMNKVQIERILKVPYDLRFKWGLYKNLICGVTAVIHHGTGRAHNYKNMPDVLAQDNYLHSVRLEKHWRLKLNLIFNGRPFVIHTGEGKNRKSINEINELIKWNIFRKDIIGVHGISLDDTQSRKFKALVWCPDSNLFLYDKTAEIPKLKNNANILFGTDSTLSADWNIWNHLRLARNMNFLSDKELYKSITETAAKIWNINSSGSLSIDNAADIVVIKSKNIIEWKSFYSSNPENILVIIKHGIIVFIDTDFAERQPFINLQNYDLISINSIRKYVTKGIIELMNSIKGYLPEYDFPFTAG